MIAVTIKLLPYGKAAFSKDIGSIFITNKGTGKDPDLYSATLFEGSKIIRQTEKDIKHHRKNGVYNLLLKSLKALEVEKWDSFPRENAEENK